MHFLRAEAFSRALGKPWAMVTVELIARKVLKIQVGSIAAAKPDVLWAMLPEDMHVVDADGKKVSPSEGRRFYVTVETFNPYHGLMEASPEMFRG